MGGFISRCLKVNADGANVNVTTNVKDLIVVNIDKKGTEKGAEREKVIEIKQIRLDINPHVYIDTENRSFVRDESGAFRDKNGERFVEI